ncbi:hypothetical protein [Halorussus aquaticus]|uniref:Uncharacterized protein n=1 Tax=Halorussus aquaticus TaxID=2953748 RepID=A0ABD5QAF9_9EURY|nr:hypothetical protein [Halorussus aquaticus]
MDLLTLLDWRVQEVEELYRLIEHFEERGREFDFILYAGDDLGRFVDEETNHFDQVAEMADSRSTDHAG